MAVAVTMKYLCLLIVCFPALIHGTSSDLVCGETVDVYSNTYYIDKARTYTSPCKVVFQHFSVFDTEIQISVSAINALSPSQCSVNIYDSTGRFSKTQGNLSGYFYLPRTFTSSDGTGELQLVVSGPSCDVPGLSFVVKEKQCSEFTCDDGGCVPYSDLCDGYDDCSDGSDEYGCFDWSPGYYVGISIGVIALIAISVAAIIFRRRRMVMMAQPAILIPSCQTNIVHTRW